MYGRYEDYVFVINEEVGKIKIVEKEGIQEWGGKIITIVEEEGKKEWGGK